MSESRIDQLKKFLEQQPADLFVLYALATEYLQVGDDQTALRYFQSILEINPDYTGVYYHLGKLHQRGGNAAEAEKVFREGIKRTMGKEPRAYAELQQALSELLFENE
jgi:tetratricopeptide (TPR) repeat protein